MTQQKTNCALATALRVIGKLNILGGLLIGGHSGDTATLVLGIFAGIFACVICYALAKCVQAATAYLDSVSSKDNIKQD